MRQPELTRGRRVKVGGARPGGERLLHGSGTLPYRTAFAAIFVKGLIFLFISLLSAHGAHSGAGTGGGRMVGADGRLQRGGLVKIEETITGRDSGAYRSSAAVSVKNRRLRLRLPPSASAAALPNSGDDYSQVHFWAPTFKWGISIANVADFAKPPEKISFPQQVAVACTGVIWSRYSMVITPKNWNLFSVNVAMAGTGLYQLSRKIRKDYFSDEKDAAASLEG
uniref:Mitochondrial pyruvate carrier n=1 Tax=Oryza barthii TaxID=65489 RepID=A0A0D3GQI0_9ORYZ